MRGSKIETSVNTNSVVATLLRRRPTPTLKLYFGVAASLPLERGAEVEVRC
jgi:hypothetical protein